MQMLILAPELILLCICFGNYLVGCFQRLFETSDFGVRKSKVLILSFELKIMSFKGGNLVAELNVFADDCLIIVDEGESFAIPFVLLFLEDVFELLEKV